MFPVKIYYEPAIDEYTLGKTLREKYKDVPQIPIESHNNIFELRSRPNSDFVEMKKYLIIGVRKTHKYADNFKTSDFLVPFTSSGCSAMCLYCYLVCNYNKCSYLRIFVNQEEILNKLIKKSHSTEKECVFEIGSNSDLILENMITNSLITTIEEFGKKGRGAITFPTKFSMVDKLLNLDHNGKVIFRMSINPSEIIRDVEIGTSTLMSRIIALNKMCEAGYKVGLLIAPVIMLKNWRMIYTEMLDTLYENLTEKVKNSMFIEVIFMTYSYVHRAINDQAFPDRQKLYNQQLMTGRGRGKYCYRQYYREDGEAFLRYEIGKRFNCANIIYVV
ncbi:MAG: spore photoproduct lyase [Clostridiales bacterium GWF2_36_10]|nr:MAG: spore photoproduct lyase [Clostridiales bacterium GWF2_36_10]HAN20090.1 spore photoproduct lyase [Clostridiales bacterium]